MNKMSKEIKIHIISHTHWDREWFLDSKYTSEWLITFFNSLFSILKKEIGYTFVLDGQSLIVEDFFKELRRQKRDSSKYRKLITKYCKQGKVLIGPYYMQPDSQLVSGESLVRNLLIGHQIAERLGAIMKAGWLLDNFGQVSQTVQIHDQFNLKGLFVWRGVEMEPTGIRSEFLWESPDKTKLLTIYLLSSYRNAMRLGKYKEIMNERILNEVQKIFPFATTSNVLLMNGYDQEMVPDEFISDLKRQSFLNMQVTQSTPEKYLEAIEKENPELKVLKGALYSGRYISVFPGTLSTRVYLKFLNDQCQQELERYTEPLSVLSWLVGWKYNRKELIDCWKKLLKNHPHDNICGVSIDDVHTGMEKSFHHILSKSRQISNNKLSELAMSVDTLAGPKDSTTYLLFNPTQEIRNKVLSITRNQKRITTFIDSQRRKLPQEKVNTNSYHVYIDRIPSFGFKAIYTSNKQEKSFRSSKLTISNQVIVEKNRIENQFVQITINNNGNIDVFDNINQCHYRGLGIFIDSADAGDEYNYSCPENDIIFSTENCKARIEIIEKSSLKVIVKISLVMQLPESLSADRKTRLNKYREFPIITWISLEAQSPIIYFKTSLKNTVKDHRLRVLFSSDIDTRYSFAGTQFDITRHRIKEGTFDDHNIPDNVQRIMIGAREKRPITTFPHCSFVNINNGKRGIALLDRGLKEYEILPERNTIALTLFRSIGWLARGDLLSRIGDAGPTIFTPEAQCLRQMTFHYALVFHQGDCYQGGVPRLAEEFNIPPRLVKTNGHKGNWKENRSILQVKSTNNVLRVTALKKAEKGNATILRLFNCSPNKVKGEISVDSIIRKVYLVNLREEIIKEIQALNKYKFKLTVKPKKIVTLKLFLEKRRPIGIKRDFISNQKNVEFLDIENSYEANFIDLKTVPLLTRDDILHEDMRIKEIEKKLEKAKKRIINIRNKMHKDNNPDSVNSIEFDFYYHKARGDVETLQREKLEANLSLLLAKKKYHQIYAHKSSCIRESLKEINEKLRKIGYALNYARINKRAYEYIVEYYQHRLNILQDKTTLPSNLERD